MRLSTAYRALWLEAAQMRFRLNFGTPICEMCDGLKAGPGVTATCFQVRQCTYDNVKQGDVTPRQKRVIESLMGSLMGSQNNLTPKKS